MQFGDDFGIGSCWYGGDSSFAVEDIGDVDADGFEFVAEDVADAVFAADVGGEIGCVAGADGFAEGNLGLEFLFDLFTEPEGFFPVFSCNGHKLLK